jgi:hypothetical protein
MFARIRKPSPAMMVALLALFVALSGSAWAVGSKIVPHAKLADVALVANNAKKLGGQTSAAVVSQAAAAPGPASTAASLVSTKTGAFSIPANGFGTSTVSCDPGQKAIGGGYTTVQVVLGADWTISADGASYSILLLNLSSTTATGTVQAVCLK